MAQAFPDLSSASLRGVPQLPALWLFSVLSNLWLSSSQSAICQEERNKLRGGEWRGLGKSINELKIIMGQLWMSLRHFSSPSPQLMLQSKRGQAAMKNSLCLQQQLLSLPSGHSCCQDGGLPHCYRKSKTKQMKRNLPQNNPSASWHHRKFCESGDVRQEKTY